MPKRTNDFQDLIKTIYEQIVPEGGTVTESGILREVDILVEYIYAGHEFSFIVECRDRSRSETVEWIDGLIGKTKSLNVNKVIAVSSKGFASSAEKKAKENGEIVGNLRGLIEHFFQEYLVPQINEYKINNFLELFKTKEDVEKMLVVQSEYDWPGICVVSGEGTRIEIKKVKYVVLGNRKSMGVKQEHHESTLILMGP